MKKMIIAMDISGSMNRDAFPVIRESILLWGEDGIESPLISNDIDECVICMMEYRPDGTPPRYPIQRFSRSDFAREDVESYFKTLDNIGGGGSSCRDLIEETMRDESITEILVHSDFYDDPLPKDFTDTIDKRSGRIVGLGCPLAGIDDEQFLRWLPTAEARKSSKFYSGDTILGYMIAMKEASLLDSSASRQKRDGKPHENEKTHKI